jgi:hypothetical protein
MTQRNEVLRPQFWERYPLGSLTPAEWEALCDGCGRCCLHKLEYEDTGDIAYTSIACRLLDVSTARCSDYPNRQHKVPDCVTLTPDNLSTIKWLPTSCAYRRLYEGRKLAAWHPLLSGSLNSVREAGISVIGRVQSELDVAEEDVEEYVIRWVRVK